MLVLLVMSLLMLVLTLVLSCEKTVLLKTLELEEDQASTEKEEAIEERTRNVRLEIGFIVD